MTDTTDRFALPLIQTGQAQKEITHNEALGLIDSLLQIAVDDIVPTPPPAPAIGHLWIVAAGATGIWAGRDGALAGFTSAGWTYLPPRDGCVAWVVAVGVFALFRAGSWQVGAWPVRSLTIGGRAVLGATPTPLATVTGGGVVDAEARAAIAAIAAVLRAQGLATA